MRPPETPTEGQHARPVTAPTGLDWPRTQGRPVAGARGREWRRKLGSD